MASVLEELASEAGTELPADERDALGRSLPGWPVFPEVPAALAEARDHGWRLAALTNSDRDLIDASLDVDRRPLRRDGGGVRDRLVQAGARSLA